MTHSLRVRCAIVLVVCWLSPFLPAAENTPAAPRFLFSCRADNDLFRVVTNYWPGSARYDSAADAIAQAAPGVGVLILADGYPEKTTEVSPASLVIAKGKNLRLYVEYPANLPGLDLGQPRGTEWERTVVASDVFGPPLPRFRILAIHGCRFVPARATAPHLVAAKVAGFDTAVYGLPQTVYPLLFEHPEPRMLVAATKLSQFVTARYAPKEAWPAIWRMVLGWLQPGTAIPALDWTSTVRTTFDRTAPLPPSALREAIIRGVDWHSNARMLVHADWEKEYPKYGNLANPVGPAPDLHWRVGEGELGLLEGFNSRILPDGSQNVRWWLRTDCNGESALSFALRAKIDGDARSRRVAGNLLDWVYFNSKLLHDDSANANFGLLGWAPNVRGTYYQDNDVKAILGCLGTAALLNSDRWDEALLKNILGNFRTTGVYGFRGESLNDPGLQQHGWLYYWRVPTLHYSGHFESWIWATYLWLYDKTHFTPLLERSKTAIRHMMAAYPGQWRWTNGIQQERGRMLLTLAWLVRVEDTPEHRAWLKRIATDLLAGQVQSGAIREALGDLRLGYMRPPQSNEAYGTGEAPLIHQNGDPVADLLYTCNFTLFGLHEAAAATGDPQYRQAEERLVDFLLRVQVKSETHPELDGAWFRAFDFNRWDYWASNSDWGWGAWAVECGWTQGWIITGLALHYLNLNLWDLSKNSRVAENMARIRPLLLPDDKIAVPETENKVGHQAVGKSIVSLTTVDPRHPGHGAVGLTDGLIGLADASMPWAGYEGIDCEAVIDLGTSVPIRQLAAHFLQQTSLGIYLPIKVEFAVSDDGERFRAFGAATPRLAVREPGPKCETLGLAADQAQARFVRMRAVSLKRIPDGQPAAGRKAWLFIDEILVNPHDQLAN